MKQFIQGFVMTIGVLVIVAITCVIAIYEPMRVLGVVIVAYALKRLVLI